jgi:beta-galactosidase/beta-glucuronidase
MLARLSVLLLPLLILLGAGDSAFALAQVPTVVSTGAPPDGHYSYLVNGQPQLFIGMGYNPMYGRLPYDQRAGRYYRDFKVLCQAGVNTITGWDSDKGYQQDTFDELTLDSAQKYGIGVVMPIYLPVDGTYNDAQFTNQLLTDTTAKVTKYKNHPALRMWGVGNEVLGFMQPAMQPAFASFFLQLVDRVRSLDQNHPVIYRDAEDWPLPAISKALAESGDRRPWLLYGMNIYNQDPGPLLDRWPGYGFDRPLFVSEFGSQPSGGVDRAQGYAGMWRSIRARGDFVLGGAPYVWTTEGPEPTDKIWGLMNADGQPIDGTFDALRQLWLTEPGANHSNCG